MKGLMRMLMMFGPMIFRQFQKYQRNKAREEQIQTTDRHANGKHEDNSQQGHISG